MSDKVLKCIPCGIVFKHHSAYSRHKHRSCKFNPNRIPRSPRKKRNSSNLQDAQDHIIVDKQKLSNDRQMSSEIQTLESENKMIEEIVVKTTQNVVNELKESFKQQVDTIQSLIKRLENKSQPNVFNIEKIQIYVTDKAVDFVEVLTKRFGSRKRAIDYIRSKVNKKVEGDVDVFCDIYLHGAPDTWPISCIDKKNHVFRIAQPDSKVISDPGGVQIYDFFKNAYSNTLLRLNNAAIYETLNLIPGTAEYEASRDNLLDSFELGVIQAKAHDLCKASCDPFVKKLAIKLKSLEKSHELDSINE